MGKFTAGKRMTQGEWREAIETIRRQCQTVESAIDDLEDARKSEREDLLATAEEEAETLVSDLADLRREAFG